MKLDSELDKFDRALLDILQIDNSIPLRELAEIIHLSPASVQRRVQRLRKIGVIRANAAIIDPEKVGQMITLLVEVHADTTESSHLSALKESFSGKEIQQCYYVTGDSDFVLILTVSSMEEFNEIAERIFYSNKHVKWFKTLVVMDRVKSTLLVQPMKDD